MEPAQCVAILTHFYDKKLKYDIYIYCHVHTYSKYYFSSLHIIIIIIFNVIIVKISRILICSLHRHAHTVKIQLQLVKPFNNKIISVPRNLQLNEMNMDLHKIYIISYTSSTKLDRTQCQNKLYTLFLDSLFLFFP